MNIPKNCKSAMCAFAVLLVWGIVRASASQAPEAGQTLFNERCKSCHDPAIQRAPSRPELGLRPRSEIVAALTTGIMGPMAKGLGAPEIEAISQYLVPAQVKTFLGEDKACASNASITVSNTDWPSVGFDSAGSRFQPNPGFTVAEVPRLRPKWTFSMPGGGQPIVIGDWLFMTNRGGKFYALDAKSGCVHWAVEDGEARASPVLVRSDVSPSGWMALIGATRTRNVRAFDAYSGRELWHSEALDDFAAAAVTGTPVISSNTIFVPVSSGEEVVAMQPDYPCCQFRGSIVALDLKSGRKRWRTFMITAPLRPTHKNSSGVMLQGPAGAPVWASPITDTKRGLLYVVTGDSYTDVPTKGTDAIVALDMATGKVRWRNQVTNADNFIQGCFSIAPRGANCPTPTGPDFDFGASPILLGKMGEHQVLVAGQKSGVVWGVDPDTGRHLWDIRLGSGSALGGIEWGIASDGTHLFVPIADFGQVLNEVALTYKQPTYREWPLPGRPGISAVDQSGKILWSVPAPHAPCRYAGDRSKDFTKGICVRSQSAAPSAMPGIVFSGTLDGWLRAYDSETGNIVWQYSTTAQTYNTVNGFSAQPGGGIDGMGPAIAGGMLYSMSGFNGASQTGSNGINVLIAFSIDGK